VSVHLGEGDADLVVHGHEQELPAGAVDRIAAVVRGTVAAPLDASELLGVDAQQVARGGVPIAPWTGSAGSRLQSFGRPARRSTRLTVASDSSRLAAMRACVRRRFLSSHDG